MTPSSKQAPPRSETKLIQELANILHKADLTGLEYETEEIAIRLTRAMSSAPVLDNAPNEIPAANHASQKTHETLVTENLSDHKGAVLSPMVGTVYTSPEPGAPRFVSEGDLVKEGQTIFIVEAMKVMNPIIAPATGKITNILVQNAQPIEFGEVLAIID